MNRYINNIFYRLSVHFPQHKYEINKIYDFIETLSFWLSFKHRKRLLQNFESCLSAKNFYHFASTALPSHQLENEIVPFLDFVKKRQPKVVCEIGTAEGGTNFLLSNTIKSVQHIIGMDLYVHNRAKLKYFSKPKLRQSFFDGNSHSNNISEQVKSVLKGELIDLLFIDGDHTYNGVKQDFECYRPYIAQGGLVAFHDIIPDFKTSKGTETDRWAGDVPVFWKQIKTQFKYKEFVENYDQDGLGIGVLILDN